MTKRAKLKFQVGQYVAVRNSGDGGAIAEISRLFLLYRLRGLGYWQYEKELRPLTAREIGPRLKRSR